MLLSDTASLVFIMVGPGYQGARELDLLPRKKDERDAGAQQFPWQQLEVVMRIESGETQRWEQDFCVTQSKAWDLWTQDTCPCARDLGQRVATGEGRAIMGWGQ